MKNITHEDLITHLAETDKLTLIDTYAVWCKPCDRMNPVLDNLEQDFDLVTFLKVDADSNPDYMMEQRIKSIPTLLLYNSSGDVIGKWEGGQDETEIRTWMQNIADNNMVKLTGTN